MHAETGCVFVNLIINHLMLGVLVILSCCSSGLQQLLSISFQYGAILLPKM